jgi:hypothetical protein
MYVGKLFPGLYAGRELAASVVLGFGTNVGNLDDTRGAGGPPVGMDDGLIARGVPDARVEDDRVKLGGGTNVGNPDSTIGGGAPPVGMEVEVMGRGVLDARVEDERVKLGAGTNVGKPDSTIGGGGAPVGIEVGVMGRGEPDGVEDSSVHGSDVLGFGVTVVEVEQGSLEKTGPMEMLGMPGICVNAGALLGLNDSDAGS